MMSCATKEESTTNDLEPITIQVEGAKFDVIDSKSFLDESEFIFLETKKECIIGDASGFLLSTNEFFIVDRRGKKTVFRFSKEGKFLNTIGKQGQGPEEYNSINDVLVNDEFIEILNRQTSYNVIKFTRAGEFIEKNFFELKVPSSFIKIPESDDYLFYCNYGDYKVLRVNPEGLIVDSLLHQKQEDRLLLPADLLMGTTQGSIFFNEALYNIIWQWDGKQFIKKYILDFGKYTFYQGENDNDRYFETTRDKGNWGIQDYQENDDFFYFVLLFNDPDVQDFADVSIRHFVYSKKKNKTFEISNGDIHIKLRDPFAITDDNKLYLFGSPAEMADWEPWVNTVEERNLPFDIEGNPIVIIVDLDELID